LQHQGQTEFSCLSPSGNGWTSSGVSQDDVSFIQFE
jgi:hypothetical protein